MNSALIGTRLCASLLFALASFVAPSSFAQSTAEIDSLAPGLWVIHHESPTSKTVVAEFTRFLAVIESPGDDARAREVLAALDERFPTQPVRFLLHTHPHGHSIGAIDPYLVRGVTFVTSDANLESVQGLSSDPERVAAQALMVDAKFVIEDTSNRMVVHVLTREEFQTPTDDYVVFEFPQQALMVSGCLYNKPLDYHEVVNARKPGFHRFLTEHAPSVVTLVPTNTTTASGYEDVCNVEMLQTTLREGIDPQQVADRLIAMSLEEIEAQLDAMVEEFSARTPKVFDLLVCANTLRVQRADPSRAALLFEVALGAFPDSADAAYYLGVSRWESADHASAATSWERALALTDTDERDALRERIEAVKLR